MSASQLEGGGVEEPYRTSIAKTEELDGLFGGGGNDRLGGTISDNEDLELGRIRGDEEDLRLVWATRGEGGSWVGKWLC